MPFESITPMRLKTAILSINWNKLALLQNTNRQKIDVIKAYLLTGQSNIFLSASGSIF